VGVYAFKREARAADFDARERAGRGRASLW
jgi:hypothetical protein